MLVPGRGQDVFSFVPPVGPTSFDHHFLQDLASYDSVKTLVIRRQNMALFVNKQNKNVSNRELRLILTALRNHAVTIG